MLEMHEILKGIKTLWYSSYRYLGLISDTFTVSEL